MRDGKAKRGRSCLLSSVMSSGSKVGLELCGLEISLNFHAQNPEEDGRAACLSYLSVPLPITFLVGLNVDELCDNVGRGIFHVPLLEILWIY